MKSSRVICAQTLILILVICAFAFASQVQAQQRAEPQAEQTDEVVRVRTELVQTDVMVFDRRGNFVDGLRPEQFELSLNGQSRAISFFDALMSGSDREAAQLERARAGAVAPKGSQPIDNRRLVERGRLIFFFVDDLHLSNESLARTRQAISHFIERQMNPNDQLAVVSTSGQIGFLQQLTDNPAVLRTAIARLNYKRNPETNADSTRISEYMASQIEDGGDKGLFAYLMESVKMEYQMSSGSRAYHGNNSAISAANILNSRVRQISAQSRAANADTLAVLQSLMMSSADLPGRKLVFFLSDGFVVDPRGSNAVATLHQVSEIASRVGAVVYTMDMRSGFFETPYDVSRSDYVEMAGRRAGLLSAEIAATQAPLRLLADETGGRFLPSNSIDDSFQQAVQETSAYYVLAWRPDSEEQRNSRARLKVTIKDRPDLTVRVRRSLYVPPAVAPLAANGGDNKSRNAPVLTGEAQLLNTLGSTHPQRALPVALSLGYLSTTEPGVALKISMQIDRGAFVFDANDAAQKMEVDVIGAAVDDRGMIGTFKQLLTVNNSSAEDAPPVVWNQQLQLKPGLYQVRVAVRERRTGRTGSAMQWIEIPDLAPPRLAMSSLFLGERRTGTNGKQGNAPQPISVDVDHRFARSSVLRFQTYLYNAVRGAGGPDVWVQAQVLRNNQQALTTSPVKVPAEVASDPARLPYWSEIALDQLQPGRYTLLIAATDRAGKTTATQRINFSVE